jgi:hypothetical protein
MNRFGVLGSATLICLLWANPVFAQRGFGGVLGGATLGDLRGGGINTSSRWGGTAGIFVGFRTTMNTVVSIEGAWVQKGGGDIRLDYIEVPFLVGAVLPAQGGMLRTRFYSGISVGFKVGCSATTQVVDCDRAKGTEWAWPLGLQFGRWSPNGTFVAADIRYSVGLSDAFETSSADNYSWYFRLMVGKALGP